MMQILIVDDNSHYLQWLQMRLESKGYGVLSAASGLDAVRLIQEKNPNPVILDMMLPDIDGKEVLRRAFEINRNLVVIMLTAFASIQDAVESMRLGAYDYIEKDATHKKLFSTVGRAYKEVRERLRRSRLGIVCDDSLNRVWAAGESQAMEQLWDLVTVASHSESNVLIEGHGVTGKEMVARMIHQHGPRRDGPFTVLDCAAPGKGLDDADLFGLETWRGRRRTRRDPGYLALSAGGFLFLFEVDSLTPEAQPGFLRALGSGVFRPVGARDDERFEARVISTSMPNLQGRSRIGPERFRPDLYHLLSPIVIRLPQLGSRKEDIPELANMLRADANTRNRTHVKEITDGAMGLLVDHDWSGDIQELRNVIERAVLKVREGRITKRDIEPDLLKAKALGGAAGCLDDKQAATYDWRFALFETEEIRTALEAAGGDKKKAAIALGISVPTLYRKLKQYFP